MSGGSHRARALAAAALALGALAVPAGAANIVLMNGNQPGVGFNDPTPVAPVAGNDGTTLGQQRLNAFSAAAAYWANRLDSRVPIRIYADVLMLGCSPTSGILGSAGAVSVARDFPGAPHPNTFYVAALANALAGADQDPVAEILAHFNGRLDSDPTCLGGRGWWYGIGAPSPGRGISFYETVRHEIGHGLGFLTITNTGNGERYQNFDDSYMLLLEDHSLGKTWGQMTDGERAASARDPSDLHWTGAAAIAAGSGLLAGRHPGGHLQMYSPATLAGGSSVSHWDTAMAPDELMEPIATQNPADLVTTALLRDMGWNAQPSAGGCVRDADTACLALGRFSVEVEWTTATASGRAQLMSFGGQRAENTDSSFWWFFGPTNYELGVKVLDGCAINGKRWVFLSGLTNQGWEVTVRDNETGAVKTYTNPLGTMSPGFGDTQAFACE